MMTRYLPIALFALVGAVHADEAQNRITVFNDSRDMVILQNPKDQPRDPNIYEYLPENEFFQFSIPAVEDTVIKMIYAKEQSGAQCTFILKSSDNRLQVKSIGLGQVQCQNTVQKVNGRYEAKLTIG